jgi:hypothetical protein
LALSHARDTNQALASGRDHRLLARSRSLVEGRQRAIHQRPLDAALNRLMMQAKSLPHRKERRILSITEQYLRPLHAACRLAAGSRNRRQTCNLFVGHRQFDRLPPSGHDATPRLVNRKQGIHEQITGSMSSFMESFV